MLQSMYSYFYFYIQISWRFTISKFGRAEYSIRHEFAELHPLLWNIVQAYLFPPYNEPTKSCCKLEALHQLRENKKEEFDLLDPTPSDKHSLDQTKPSAKWLAARFLWQWWSQSLMDVCLVQRWTACANENLMHRLYTKKMQKRFMRVPLGA